ncbi:nicotinamide riboside transporter PnuC [Flavobacterium oreochromis]|uniref:Nicotinamide riboside transporter PnuC n=2 Tax=Flavobacterium oreochromis TaxID=2906078 RepID=A0ABW8P4B9_9FLAO|nr:nicotinamide riboside transporter PnuC [Flavobacterium oreochromis]OWP78171.1 nicotinamide mononucleotide transporter [Flavobacterium oreochromis]POR25001.1 nicotinamide mononucleotide transporter [Flavobacterium columnare]
MLTQIFTQYQNVPNWQIWLETIAFIFGILSVWFAKKESHLVFPTGIIATTITVYIMYNAKYMADMSINIYYTIMSIYGWYKWAEVKPNNEITLRITQTNKKEKLIGFIMFVLTGIICVGIYKLFKIEIHQNNWIDIFTTCIFFTAMWFMALKKIESWSLWILGDFLIVPILWSRELYIFAIQYIIFTFLAILAYLEWKKILNKEKLRSSE